MHVLSVSSMIVYVFFLIESIKDEPEGVIPGTKGADKQCKCTSFFKQKCSLGGTAGVDIVLPLKKICVTLLKL